MKILALISFLLIPLNTSSAKLQFNDIIGKWRLMYKHNYGYEFRFQNNYRAFCILYHSTNALVFKGIYILEDDKIRININEMKNEKNIKKINLDNKFVKTFSSYFIFNAEVLEKDSKKTLILRSLQTIIDGNDSTGYFEPEIILKRF